MVKIITDTSSLFTPEDGRQLGFKVVPLTVTIAGKTYKEREEIETAEFIEIINQGNIPSSSQPAPADLMEAYEEATEENPVLHITIADGLSGAYQSALGVREIMDNKEYITVYNSATLCAPRWVMVKTAKEMADAGCTVEEIVEMLDDLKANQKSALIPMDFDYLRRGGRLSPAAAKISKLMRLLAVMTQTEDGKKLVQLGIVRSYDKAIEKVIETFKACGITDDCVIAVSHSGSPQKAQIAFEAMKKAFPNCAEHLIFELTPAFTTQGGPLCISIQFIKKYSKIYSKV